MSGRVPSRPLPSPETFLPNLLKFNKKPNRLAKANLAMTNLIHLVSTVSELKLYRQLNIQPRYYAGPYHKETSSLIW